MTTNTEGAIVGGPAVATPAPAAPVIKAMPLMVNGILYLSLPNRVFALDARTGREIWQYVYRGRGASATAAWPCTAAPSSS